MTYTVSSGTLNSTIPYLYMRIYVTIYYAFYVPLLLFEMVLLLLSSLGGLSVLLSIYLFHVCLLHVC